jgi:hypothetical protein
VILQKNFNKTASQSGYYQGMSDFNQQRMGKTVEDLESLMRQVDFAQE